MKLKIELIGRIGQNAQLKKVEDKNVINFSVACTDKNKNGEKTTWVNCNYWSTTDLSNFVQYLKQGALVAVEGKPTTRIFTDKAGEMRVSLECAASELKILVFAKDENDKETATNITPQKNNETQVAEVGEMIKDLPF